jgi:pseudaminic acid biosynthesis-associated methylase
MKSAFGSPQEEFWAGDFGDDYISRNDSKKLLASNINLFSKILSQTNLNTKSFLEIGANIGMNINAIQKLIPDANFTAVEINKKACEILEKTGCKVIEGSIQDVLIDETFDFVFSKGVLIHLNPNQLDLIYNKLFKWSRKYILIAEYYNPTPVSIDYRGNSEKLFKRDFAGELMDKFPQIKLLDCGFAYHRSKFPQDDISWFLLQKE